MSRLTFSLALCITLSAATLAAQTKGSVSGGFHSGRGGFAHTGVPTGSTTTTTTTTTTTDNSRPAPGTYVAPIVKGSLSFPSRGVNRSCFGLNCFATDFFPPSENDGFFPRHHGFGSGFGYYPYVSYGGSYYGYPGYDFDQDYQQQLQRQQSGEEARALTILQEDRRQQFELAQQLEDQRAADAASRAREARQPAQAAPAPAPTPSESTAAVLVFRDQRRQEIGNYALTPTAVYAFGQTGWHKIPLSQLDIPATIAANNDRGIQFNIPASRK